MLSRPFPLLVACTLLALAATASLGALKIEKKPASVQRKTFDPANPPKDLPKLNPGEEAMCTYNFDFQTGINVEVRKLELAGGKFKVVYTIRGVSGKLGLDLVIWLPEGASAKLKAHEEGHREIAEMAYKTADVVAKKLADKIDGRRIEAIGDTWEAAEKTANEEIKKLNDGLTKGYLEAVSDHTKRVQDHYDDITAHGTRPQPDEKEAIRQSWARFGPIGTPAPATRPAVAPRPATKPAVRG